MSNIKKPELLAPAGDFERLKAAITYGADAVYLGGTRFGMRAAPQNFTDEELKKAVAYAHERNVKIYLTCNIMPNTAELKELPEFLQNSAQAGVDAFIISDLGVMSYAKKYAPEVEIHISTQTGVVNSEAAKMLYDLGAKRIVTARELSMKEITELKRNMPKDMDLECFVHGAMCVSYSGRCLLSNYLTNRYSNKGECSQPCRWQYHIVEKTRPNEYIPIEETKNGTYIMNSKDMCMIDHVPEMIEAGITSFKIEGRAKTEYYTAVVTNAYRSAIDEFIQNPSDDFKISDWIHEEPYKISHRGYCTGFYYGSPMEDANIYYDGGYIREWEVAAVAVKCENGRLTVSQRNRFFEGEMLEIMNKGKAPTQIIVKNLKNAFGESIDSAPNPMAEFSLDCDIDVPEGAFIRKIIDAEKKKAIKANHGN